MLESSFIMFLEHKREHVAVLDALRNARRRPHEDLHHVVHGRIREYRSRDDTPRGVRAILHHDSEIRQQLLEFFLGLKFVERQLFVCSSISVSEIQYLPQVVPQRPAELPMFPETPCRFSPCVAGVL